MAPSRTDIAGTLEAEALRRRRWAGSRLLAGSWGIFVRISTRSRSGKLEAGRSFLLLSELGSLLRFGKGKRVTTLVTAARRTATTTAVTAVFVSLAAHLLLLVVLGIPRGTGRRGRRRAHAHARHGGLVAAMGGLVGRVHRDARLLLAAHLGELEGVHLGRNAPYRGAALDRWIEIWDLAHLVGLQ